MLLGALALWLCGRGLRGDRRAFALGGLVVGLAFLSRNDGVLLGVPFALAFLLDLLRRLDGATHRLAGGARCARAGSWSWRRPGCCASWTSSARSRHRRRAAASSGSREYRELYSVTSETTLAASWRRAWRAHRRSRLGGLVRAVVIFARDAPARLPGALPLVGAWQRRRDPAFTPWLVYALTLFLFSAALSAVHVPYGTFIHSAVALVPHAYLLALVGMARRSWTGWPAGGRPGARPRATRRIRGHGRRRRRRRRPGGSIVTTRAWSASVTRAARCAAALDDGRRTR